MSQYSSGWMKIRGRCIKAVRSNPGGASYSAWNALPFKYRAFGKAEALPYLRQFVIRGWQFGTGLDGGDMRFHRVRRGEEYV